VPFARSHLVADLRRLGLKAGDIVMVHASVRAVGPVHGGPDEIHQAVFDAVSPGGTVMMFLGCQAGVDDVGRGVYSPEDEADILAHHPPFDPHTARAQREFGVLAEFFRSSAGTVCSTAACARVGARGARAAWLVADAPWNYGFGPGSPFAKLVEARGRVLLLGSSHDEVTMLHYAEHIADFPDKRVVRYRVPWSEGGQRVWRDVEEFNTGGDGVHPHWPHDFFARIVDDFLRTHPGPRGKVGNAESLLLDAAALVRHAVLLMQQQARQPQPVLG
jgi:aminoglycoside 3-N-acetyltransferase